ncbi:MAG: ABC transporter ATP-binding protein [Ruminococcaceae bacterium]|nr:ABC transporter ATP-binding protein [Oscillospiraceae bacterium]
MIRTNNLTKRFKDKTAVNSLNLTINKGELFSLLGVNGAGKTTTVKMLSTLITPTSGEIFIKGINTAENKAEIRKIINISPQETAIAPNLTVMENIEFMSGVYALPKSSDRIEKLINDFKLEEILKQKAKTLSGGWQRRLSIALSLINDPEILFLDEPTLGLDVLARRELWSVINGLKGKITVILTTHYMEEAEKLSDRVGIMSKGHLTHIGTPQELIEAAQAKSFEDAFVTLANGGEAL